MNNEEKRKKCQEHFELDDMEGSLVAIKLNAMLLVDKTSGITSGFFEKNIYWFEKVPKISGVYEELATLRNDEKERSLLKFFQRN